MCANFGFGALAGGYGEDGARRVPDHALGRASAQRIEDTMMTRGRHAYEIDVKFDRGIHD